jgi:hypothetical protein
VWASKFTRKQSRADYSRGCSHVARFPNKPVLGAYFHPFVCRTALLAAIGLSWAASASALATEQANARQVKAAFVINFVKFVAWPDSFLPPAPAPIIVAVVGDREFGTALLQAANGQAANDRRIEVRILSREEDIRTAHLVFIGGSEERRLPAILRGIEDTPVLTVGDTRGYAEAGVVLNFYTFDQRIRIEVNTTAAARAQLRLSAHLLRIARIVG